MRIRRLTLGVLLSLALTAWAQDVGQGSPPSTSGPSQATERPSASVAPAATAEFPAPAELQGPWEAVMGSGSDIELEIRETGYKLTQATGAIGGRSRTTSFASSP